MAKTLVKSTTAMGTAEQFRAMMQRMQNLQSGSWAASDGEVLKFSEKRNIVTFCDTDGSFGLGGVVTGSRQVDKTPPGRTSWVITSAKPVTEEEQESKAPAIREEFGADRENDVHLLKKLYRTAGIEVYETQSDMIQVDFLDEYTPYSNMTTALLLPIGPAFAEFSAVVLEELEKVRSQVKPKWLTKRTSEEVQMHVQEVVQTIEGWIPKRQFSSEEAYEAALAEYLVGRGIDAPEQQGKSLTDILAANGIGVEVKLAPNRSDYDRLSGQIMRQLEEYGVVIVLILRPDKRDLLAEYRSRFDERVIFISK